MCGGGGVPPPPAPTAEETELNRETLNLLRQTRTEQEALRPLLLTEAGLKSKADIPGTPEYEKAQRLKTNIGIYQNRLDTGEHESSGYKLNDEDKKYYKELISGWKGDLSSVSAGYEKTAERLAAEERSKKLQEKVDSATERQLNLYGLQADRMEKALRGELPLSEASMQRKSQDFNLLKENLARAGNPIIGDDPGSAYSLTTAGNQALEAFNKRYGLMEDAERRGEISAGSGETLAALGLTSNIGNTRQGIIQGTGAGGQPYQSLVGGPASLIGGYQSAMQPYQFQRSMQYQGDMQNAANKAQERAGYLSLAGQAVGSGAALYALSSRSAKKNLKKVGKEGERKSLDLIKKGDIYEYDYKDEPTKKRRHHVGLVTEESPRELVAPDGKHLDVVNYLGSLTGAIRELDRKVTSLAKGA